MERTIRHLPGIDELLVQRAKLEAADHVGDLIQWRIAAVERASHFALRVSPLEANRVDKKFHRLLGSHFPKVKIE